MGALLVVIDTVPRLDHAVRWRNVEYERLASLHAGYQSDYVIEQLGTPTQTRTVGQVGFRELTFVRREHFVQVVTDPSDRVVMLSITSCDPDFQPVFEPVPGAFVHLQSGPLVNQPTVEGHSIGASLFAEDRRTLGYQVGVSATTPDSYWEWTGPGSNATGSRSWFVGVDPLCLSSEQHSDIGTFAVPYSGPAADAPPEAQRLRSTYAANTYAETVAPLTPVIGALSQVVIASGFKQEIACREGPADPTACGDATIGTFGPDLPPGLLDQGSTREFDAP